MTAIDSSATVASGTVTPQRPPPQLPDIEDAQNFYLQGFRGSMTGAVRIRHLRDKTPPGFDDLTNALVRGLEPLMALRPGWDGERARPITSEAVYSALRVLSVLLDEEAVPPRFFPLPDGGIQLGWYADEGELEVEIEIDRSGEAYATGTSATGPIEGTLDPLAKPSELASRLQAVIKEISLQLSK